MYPQTLHPVTAVLWQSVGSALCPRRFSLMCLNTFPFLPVAFHQRGAGFICQLFAHLLFGPVTCISDNRVPAIRGAARHIHCPPDKSIDWGLIRLIVEPFYWRVSGTQNPIRLPAE
ncbi:MAG: hypothetical protein C7B44_04060 [Sulfobacillus thermosulfidooxidans]|nr:MAG: hypothetical protein C7B44_04060 [Sulfobacillus thermosulfidooxidans]